MLRALLPRVRSMEPPAAGEAQEELAERPTTAPADASAPAASLAPTDAKARKAGAGGGGIGPRAAGGALRQLPHASVSRSPPHKLVLAAAHKYSPGHAQEWHQQYQLAVRPPPPTVHHRTPTQQHVCPLSRAQAEQEEPLPEGGAGQPRRGKGRPLGPKKQQSRVRVCNIIPLVDNVVVAR